MKGHIREVFTSIQGEGIRVGERMFFVRFLGCNLSCNYCDTPEAQARDGDFVEQGKAYRNPIDVDRITHLIPAQTVALTGGEPLLQIGFLVELCRELQKRNIRTYLETNGSMPAALQKVIEYVDVISLDFKIPTATGGNQLWDDHAECLAIASSKDVFVKIVIDENILPRELMRTREIIRGIDRTIPLVIQPVSGMIPPNILDIQHEMLEHLDHVLVIPQIHKYLNIP